MVWRGSFQRHLGSVLTLRCSRVHGPDALCTSAQTLLSARVTIAIRLIAAITICSSSSVGIVLVAVVPRMWVPGGVNSTNLGWMSEQWLAEHRASHST